MKSRSRRIAGALALVVCAAALVTVSTCHRKRSDPPPAAAAVPAPPLPKQPDRTAIADQDLRTMLADLVSAKACELIRGAFRPLRDAKRPGVVTGVLYIRSCEIARHGARVTLALSGDGWQWAAAETKKAGATFALHQYVRFAADSTITGALDLGYDPKSHVASVWFTPTKTPDVHFTPLGDLSVDKKGAWSKVVGAMSSVIGSSPESQAHDQAVQMGDQQFADQFGRGLSTTIDLCDGVARFNLGHPATGAMMPPDTGETRKVPVELQPGGVMMFGPEPPGKGLTVTMHASAPVRASLVCADAADGLARAWAERGAQPNVTTLASKWVNGAATLHVAHPQCNAVLVVRSASNAPVAFDWTRPPAEKAAGPLVKCSD